MSPVQFFVFFAVVAVITAITAMRVRTSERRVVVCAIGTILIVTGPHVIGEVRTRLYMASIEDDVPMSSILAADPKLRAPMLQAMRRGFSASVSFYGSTGGNVYDKVNEVVRPFMENRLSHASDETVRKSAGETLGKLIERRADKDEEACHAAMAADNRMFYGWSDAGTPWAIEMIDTAKNASPRTASPNALRSFLRNKGSIPRYDMNWKMPPTDAPSACDELIVILDAAIGLPRPDDAAMLRALGFPRFVGQRTISYE
jgi:hypothetical protein